MIEFEVTGLAFKRFISLMNSFNMLAINMFVLFEQIWHNIYYVVSSECKKCNYKCSNFRGNFKVHEGKKPCECKIYDTHMKLFLMLITSSNIIKKT